MALVCGLQAWHLWGRGSIWVGVSTEPPTPGIAAELEAYMASLHQLAQAPLF